MTLNEFITRDEHVVAVLDVEALVARGEDENLEFKSSARWDYREGQANKTLEVVIVKTIAGFLNGNGGILVIGVNDDGEVLGLEPDYKTLNIAPLSYAVGSSRTGSRVIWTNAAS
jgi:predicted HTH transcriptional regulator